MSACWCGCNRCTYGLHCQSEPCRNGQNSGGRRFHGVTDTATKDGL